MEWLTVPALRPTSGVDYGRGVFLPEQSPRVSNAYIRDWQLRILKRAGVRLPAGATVLDFGCGKGELVGAWRDAGFDAHGCDLAVELGGGERLAAIEEPYRLPYGAATFDLVLSRQVFEHVQDPERAFAEIARVLKPDGASLHQFPSRYYPIEPHTLVPLASLIRARPWLWLWALLGVRNPFQQGLPASETVRRNAVYLREHTHYLRRRDILRFARPLQARFVEREAIETSRTRVRRLEPLAPLLGRIYSGLLSRWVLLRPTTMCGG
jgi:SAM-dependent methyltransferase